MSVTEYWSPTGEWTASGCTRFVKATIAPPMGRSIRVRWSESGVIDAVWLIDTKDDRDEDD